MMGVSGFSSATWLRKICVLGVGFGVNSPAKPLTYGLLLLIETLS